MRILLYELMNKLVHHNIYKPNAFNNLVDMKAGNANTTVNPLHSRLNKFNTLITPSPLLSSLPYSAYTTNDPNPNLSKIQRLAP